MRFVYPWLLLLLTAIPVIGAIWIWLYHRSQIGLSKLISPALQAKLMPVNRQSQFYTQFVLIMCALTLLLFAAARPQWGKKDQKVFSRGRNLLIALDVSRSMLAADVHPNRLERAKTDIIDLIEELEGDRAGLLAFRKKANIICPLTTDYTFLRQALDGVSIDSAPRGETDLGDAIEKSLEALEHALDEYNAILLISDGEDLKGNALKAAAKAGDRGVPIFTVGIGDPAGTTIPSEDNSGTVKFRGQNVTTKLMDKTLSAIASASNGRYIPLGTAGTAHTTLGAIYRRHLRQITAKEQQEVIENRYQERYQLFLIPAILLLLSAAWFSRGRLHGSLKRKGNTAAAVTALILSMLSMITTAAETNGTPQITATAPETFEKEIVVVKPGRAGARKAQAWMKRGDYSKAAQGFLSAARGAEVEEAETYRYNAAFSWYQDGDTTNACNTLRSLLNSKAMGARAGELLGKILYDEAHKQSSAEDPAAKLKQMEEAAAGFQYSLRETPEDERCNRNLTRAVDPLADLRMNAHIAEVMKEHGKTQPDQLVSQMLTEQRNIMDESYTAFTNEAPVLIQKSEALAERQKENGDLWIPLKQHLLQAVTNQQQQAMLNQQIELGRDSMKGTTLAFEDLMPEAAQESAQIEPLLYNFWKMVAAPNSIIDEDITCQSNTLSKIDRRYLEARDSQSESRDLTEIFTKSFPPWADQYIKKAQSDTNMPPFTAEDKAEIEELAAHVLKMQKEITEKKLSKTDAKPLQQQALKELLEIQKKLPKNPNNQKQQQQQQQKQDQQQQQQQEQEQKQEQEQEQEQQEEKKEEPKPEESKEKPPEDVQELLRRALEREKEHEDDKKKQMRNIPMSPSEKDW
ncbi:MAG: VWA domain-containing protein [Kiritimatiellae bacterium]|jgi:Ca-activated chloride channel family protein|nr:VWA domain-containing protein [Kiritimatiellia bacterium]